MNNALRVTFANPGENALRVTDVGGGNTTYYFHTLTTANSARSNRVLDTTTYLDAITRHYTGSYYLFEADETLPAQFECICIQLHGGEKHYFYPFVRTTPPHDISDNPPEIMNYTLPSGVNNHILTDYPDAIVFNPAIVTSIPDFNIVRG